MTAIRWFLCLVGVTLATFVASVTSASAQTELVEYYTTDTLGSIRVVFDPSGNVKARSDYEPFGAAYQPSGNLPSQRFTGQQRDAEEGFDYFNARSYLPRAGRFNAADPVFAGTYNPQAWNRYSYALNNPLMFTDPTGLQADACNRNNAYTMGEDGQLHQIYSGSQACQDNQGGGGGGGGSDWYRLWTLFRDSFYTTTYSPEENFYYGGSRGSKPDPPLLTPPPNVQNAEGVDMTEPIIEGVQTVLSLGAKPAVKNAAKKVAEAVKKKVLKPVNLPSWKKVGIDMKHVLERHKHGAGYSATKTEFPYNMSDRGIESAVRDAYRYGSQVGGAQGERILIRGEGGGLTIEMWFNRATGVIETAYPVKP